MEQFTNNIGLHHTLPTLFVHPYTNNSLQDGSEEDHHASHGLPDHHGFVKDQIYRTPVRDLADLQEIIYAAVNIVTPHMLHNTWVEVDYRLDTSRAINGRHIEVYGA